MGTFSRVIYDPTQKEIAKVNRDNGTLYLNSKIWTGLPANQREFVLLHEKGHLTMQTPDEFEANKYAVGQFAPVRTLTNNELGQRIVIMRDILTPRAESGFLGDIIGSVAQVLPVLGIGSKARIKETEAQASLALAQSEAAQKKNNSMIMMIVIAGVLIIAGLSVYLILRK